MGYQALLFCPDEKTARTVAQVLGELDFEVVPCTEPFAAVKKMMGAHFDAVVVDCENEQNAALIFKSTHSAVHAQAALAVAVVEGQAGVAKAFRIGANLVLTKPINVEQAKGTLRVARGLLRKSESAKAASAATAESKLSETQLVETGLSETKSFETKPFETKPAPVVVRPQLAHKIAVPAMEVEEEVLEAATITLPHLSAPVLTPPANASVAAMPGAAKPQAKTSAAPPTLNPLPAFAVSGAASAPARGREPIGIATPKEASDILLSPEEIAREMGQKGPDGASSAAALSPPAFTFEANKASSPRSKKVLLAIAAIVLVATAAYFAWTQFGLAQRFGISLPAASQVAPSNMTPATPVPPSAPVVAAPSPAAVASRATVVSPPSSAAKKGEVSDFGFATAAPTATPGELTSSAEKPSKIAEAPQVIKVKQSSTTAIPSAPLPLPEIAMNGDAMPSLLNSPTNAPTPRLQSLTVSQGVSRGLLIKEVKPSYPPEAQRSRIEGSVQLLATIARNGDISAVKIISGDSRLARAAADAVRQWKYKPYLLNGEPVEIQTQVTVNFKSPR